MRWIRVRDVLVVLPLFLLSAVAFAVGSIAWGVILAVLAALALFLLARASRLAARAAHGTEQSPSDVMLRWQYPGNSGGGGAGGC